MKKLVLLFLALSSLSAFAKPGYGVINGRCCELNVSGGCSNGVPAFNCASSTAPKTPLKIQVEKPNGSADNSEKNSVDPKIQNLKN